MDPVTLSLILGGLQTGAGLLQRGAAKKRRERALSELDYDIPSGVTEQVRLARERASRSGLPGEDIMRSRMESDIAGAIGKGEAVADTASDVLGLYAKMYGNKMGVERDILQRGAQYKSANELELMKSLGLMAEAENQQFYYNRFAPFLSEMGYAGQEAQGGAANIAGGLQTAYSGWMQNWMMDEYKKIHGVNQPGTVSPTMATLPQASDPFISQENLGWQGSFNQDYRTSMQEPQMFTRPFEGFTPTTAPKPELGSGVPYRKAPPYDTNYNPYANYTPPWNY